MSRLAADRWRAIVALVEAVRAPGHVVVDVGADHGHVAHALGAIAVERAPHRIGRPDVPWIVSDGLTALAHVDIAVVAGMGAHRIADIVARGPAPTVAIVAHAPDDPPTLRQRLAASGWRIDAEVVVKEGPRHAFVLRATPGIETASGEALAIGPVLLRHAPHDPLVRAAFIREARRMRDIAGRATAHDPSRTASATARADALEAACAGRAVPGAREA